MKNTGRARITKAQIEFLLSSREIEIIKLMASGFSRSDIANRLNISVFTYDEHRKNIRNKLSLRSNADWAYALVPFLK